jgi:hypothetical protein
MKKPAPQKPAKPSAPPAPLVADPPAEGLQAVPPETEVKTRYVFDPADFKCPRCHSATRATSTQGNRQYRQCLNAVCRKRKVVIGAPVKP